MLKNLEYPIYMLDKTMLINKISLLLNIFKLSKRVPVYLICFPLKLLHVVFYIWYENT